MQPFSSFGSQIVECYFTLTGLLPLSSSLQGSITRSQQVGLPHQDRVTARSWEKLTCHVGSLLNALLIVIFDGRSRQSSACRCSKSSFSCKFSPPISLTIASYFHLQNDKNEPGIHRFKSLLDAAAMATQQLNNQNQWDVDGSISPKPKDHRDVSGHNTIFNQCGVIAVNPNHPYILGPAAPVNPHMPPPAHRRPPPVLRPLTPQTTPPVEDAAADSHIDYVEMYKSLRAMQDEAVALKAHLVCTQQGNAAMWAETAALEQKKRNMEAERAKMYENLEDFATFNEMLKEDIKEIAEDILALVEEVKQLSRR